MGADNGANHNVTLRYKHEAYDVWSGPVSLEPGVKIRLQRGLWFNGVRGISVIDGRTTYLVSPAGLAAFHRVCDGVNGCELSYLGNGRLRAFRE